MCKKIFLFLMVLLLISIPIYAEALNWQPVNYSNPDSISENGLSIEEFNSLSKADWLDILGDKKKVNFAFSATSSKGEDITSEINPDLSIEINGINQSQTIGFNEVKKSEPHIDIDSNTQVKINNTILEYNKVIYVNSYSGNDIAGDGSKENPFKSLEKAFSIVNQKEAIYAVGHFSINDRDIIKGSEVDLIGENGNTTINMNRNKLGRGNGLTIRNLVIKNIDWITSSIDFYNSHVECYGVWGANPSTDIANFYNSNIVVSGYVVGSSTTNISNSYYTNDNIYKDYRTFYLNIDDYSKLVNENIFEIDYSTIENDTGNNDLIGVYGGEFAW